MISPNELAKLIQDQKVEGEFKKSDTISFLDAYEYCKNYINKNSKKDVVLKDTKDVKEESKRLIDDFVNTLKYTVEGYEDSDGLQRLREDLKDEIVNYKAITDLMEDKLVDEIRINSHKTIFYEKQGKVYRHDKSFNSIEELERVLSILIGDKARLSKATPFVNSRTVEGWRINATDKSISPIGDYTAVIRKFKDEKEKLQLVDIIEGQTLSDNMSMLLSILPKARFSFLTVGSTGSGKTVTNEIICKGIPDLDRQVYIENPCELTPARIENGVVVNDYIQLWANSEKKDPTPVDPTPNNLVENALRQTPTWIILGEARSDIEFAVLLKAATTGHNVITTFHAKDPRDAIRRYLIAYLATSSNVPAELAMDSICNSFRFIISVEKLSDGSRRIMHITEILGSDGLKPILNDIYRFEIDRVDDKGEIIGKHKRVGKLSDEAIKQMRRRGIPDNYYALYTLDPGEDEEETYNGVIK